MILVIGGAFQGKTDFVKNSFSFDESEILFNAHNIIKDAVKRGEHPEKIFFSLIKERNIQVVVCNEVGMGIVPLDKNERIYREAVGRIMCGVASMCDEVYRVQCGIPIKIKGEE